MEEADSSAVPDVAILPFQWEPIYVSPRGGPSYTRPPRGRAQLRSRRPCGGWYTISNLTPDGIFHKCRSNREVDSAVSDSRAGSTAIQLPHNRSQRVATNAAGAGWQRRSALSGPRKRKLVRSQNSFSRRRDRKRIATKVAKRGRERERIATNLTKKRARQAHRN